MYNIERKSAILEMLEQNGNVDVNTLAEKLDISRETIRRDLHDLELKGALTRTHGGAVLNKVSSNVSGMEYPVAIRGIQKVYEKKAICQKAASFIKNGDTIFVDNSSTLLYLPKFIPSDLTLTIITNSIQFLLEASKYKNMNQTFICLGGVFKQSNLSLYGNICEKTAQVYFPNKTFISCAGISPDKMITDGSIQEIEIKQEMIKRANEAFILADYSKFSKFGSFFLSNFDMIDYIITDGQTDLANLDYLSNNDIKIIACE